MSTREEGGTDAGKEQGFEFPLIRDRLVELLRAVENLLEREVPKRSPPDIVLFLRATFRLARETFGSITHLSANRASEGEALPTPEFSLTVPPLNRFLLDTAMTLTFLFEDLEPRWRFFVRAQWREMKLESERLSADVDPFPRIREFLDGTYIPLINWGVAALELSEQEAANPRTIKPWPNPGQMPNYGLKNEESLPVPALPPPPR